MYGVYCLANVFALLNKVDLSPQQRDEEEDLNKILKRQTGQSEALAEGGIRPLLFPNLPKSSSRINNDVIDGHGIKSNKSPGCRLSSY